MLYKKLLDLVYISYCSLPLTMVIHLLRGRWWPIVCPHYGAFLNVHKACIPGSVFILLPALNNPQGSSDYTWRAELLKSLWFTWGPVMRY